MNTLRGERGKEGREKEGGGGEGIRGRVWEKEGERERGCKKQQ